MKVKLKRVKAQLTSLNLRLFREWAYTTVLTQRLTDVRSVTRRSFKKKVSSSQLPQSSQDAFLSFSQEASRQCSERFLEDIRLPGTNAETVQHAWNLVHDMLCIDVHQTQLQTPNAVVAYLEELLDGVGSGEL